MGAFRPRSNPPSHYVPAAIGGVIGFFAAAFLIIGVWLCIARCGGQSVMVASYHRWREAKKKARDVEAANVIAGDQIVLADTQTEETRLAREEALAQLNGLMVTNHLVGSKLPARPQAVDFQEEQRMGERSERAKAGEQLRATMLMYQEERRQAREEFMRRKLDRGRGRTAVKNAFVVPKVAGPLKD